MVAITIRILITITISTIITRIHIRHRNIHTLMRFHRHIYISSIPILLATVTINNHTTCTYMANTITISITTINTSASRKCSTALETATPMGLVPAVVAALAVIPLAMLVQVEVLEQTTRISATEAILTKPPIRINSNR